MSNETTRRGLEVGTVVTLDATNLAGSMTAISWNEQANPKAPGPEIPGVRITEIIPFPSIPDKFQIRGRVRTFFENGTVIEIPVSFSPDDIKEIRI